MEMHLSKSRLHQLLSRFEGEVSIDMIGGIDSGVYFSFKGKANGEISPSDRIVGGRIIRRDGFCSEALMPTRRELTGRFGSEQGQAAFFARCEERQNKFERWARAFYDRRGKGKSNE
jgi:hypothetical protein